MRITAVDTREPAVPPTRQVYLHIGLHKTGTTYVQQLMRANRAPLRRQGVLFPGGEGKRMPSQVFAAWDLLGRRQRGAPADARIEGAWATLAEAVAKVPVNEAPTVLLCDEHLSLAGPRQARRAVRSWGAAEVHVVVTVRDLGRVLPSAWQEDVKNRGTFQWTAFVDAVRDPARIGTNPARGFWVRQDLPAVLATWARHVGVERVHVVTVPPPGASPDLLVERIGSVVGFDAAELPRQAAWANENVGLVGTELLRRLTPMMRHLDARQFDKAIKLTIVRRLADGLTPVRHALTDDELAWARTRGAEMVRDVRSAGYPVVGDLDELTPLPVSGRRPDDVTTEELLDASLVALAGLGEEYATSWWANKRGDAPAGAGRRARATSAARSVRYRAGRAVARVADRSPALGRLVGAYLRRGR